MSDRIDGHLIRGIGLWQATALNMIDMIGVGPFITIPLIIAAMHGPQAMLGWVLGALLVACDGLVWAELGATFPEAGGPVRYLREMYGPRAGKLLSFLFVWQLTFSAPLSMASGCIGLAQYAGYLWPALRTVLAAHEFHITIPAVGTTVMAVTITYGTFLAMSAVALAAFLLYRRITIIGRLASFLWVGVIGSALWIIVSGLLHFNARQAFTFPPGAWTFNQDFFLGYSRVPYAAALEGTYFKAFAKVHPKHGFPHVSLLTLGGVAMCFCLFKLADVVTALVVIRVMVQFLAQTIGIIVLRTRRPDLPRPFRMWLYPVPAILAFLGFVYLLIMRPKSIESIRVAIVLIVAGTILFAVRQARAQ